MDCRRLRCTPKASLEPGFGADVRDELRKGVMTRPVFVKQFGELTAEDFIQHPVWIAVHGMDDDEPWYEDCGEESFRPWTGPLPVGPEEGMLLVQATLTLADGWFYHS